MRLSATLTGSKRSKSKAPSIVLRHPPSVLVRRQYPGLSTKSYPTRSLEGVEEHLFEFIPAEETDEILGSRLRRWFRTVWIAVGKSHGGRPNMMTNYVSWAMHSSHLKFNISMVVIFYAFVILLSGLVYITKRYQPYCYIPAENDSYTGAFSMAWTTFSTVGYGNVNSHYENRCIGVSLLMSTSAFFGALYWVMFISIFYRKAMISLCDAHVSFSDVCVIRYGESESDYHHRSVHLNSSDIHFLEDMKEEEETIMCGITPALAAPTNIITTNNNNKYRQKIIPTLIFRVANNLHQLSLGSIRNFSLNCAVSVTVDYTKEEKALHPTLAPRVFYRSMKVTPTTIPYFDHVVYVRHDLDEDSPLLRDKMKGIIKNNSGSWPDEYNTNADRIKSQLLLENFKEIIVELSGLSSIDTNVWAAQRYSLSQIKIGYKFVDMEVLVTQDQDSNRSIQLDLLNTIREHRRRH